ncbi:TIGR03032 family protein [Pleurocapsa sp. PCC 7319]|uniref:TIGR03032 family protein n=1 Tax=Pleurocapsa sp. PCC 7319 TaxID=118161 RepID=UPI00037595DD|nr:TIGR03032 family protein [Pleurocapsa sp. PCC 7319]
MILATPLTKSIVQERDQSYRSLHTESLPDLLNQLGISLLVSTYQAGKLIVVRANEGSLNTHFRLFNKPMGLAADGSRLAIGSGSQIWELKNVPATAAKLHPPDKHDACYLPQNIHFTGDIDIHEMAWGDQGLWFVNTRFSCLCNLDRDHSFVPRWRPKFVSAYAPEDRCHLNGLGMVDGQPKYVTALGISDFPGGWRRNKANGGLIIDFESHEIVAQGLSMPHSPRWYRDRLWVLESGYGGLATVDPKTGQWERVVELPGFTRGLDFYGPLAFIGLSQVRETSMFSHMPIVEEMEQRICGVWVVNIESGQTVAYLKFEEAVQEIFAVQVLDGIKFPEIIDSDTDHLNASYVLPDDALAEVAFTPLNEQPIFWGDRSPTAPASVTSVVVVMPVFNLQDQTLQEQDEYDLQKTFNSIDASWTYCQAHYPQSEKLTFEVIIVDDGSTDNTWEWVNSLCADRPHYSLVQHDHCKGLAAARNTGVSLSQAQVICYCDPGSIYQEKHIFTVLTALNQPLSEDHQPRCQLANFFPAAVKTGLQFSDSVHADWQSELQQSSLLNIGIRRAAHHFIGGFADLDANSLSDDMLGDRVYHALLNHFFGVVEVELSTVETKQFSGNTHNFTREKLQQESEISPVVLALVEAQIPRRQEFLTQQLPQAGDPNHWFRLGNEAHNHGDWVAAARHYYRCLTLQPNAIEARYNLGVTHIDLEQWLAGVYHLQQVIEVNPQHVQAYNSIGMALSKQNKLEETVAYYQKAIALQPDFAKAHMNLGMILLSNGYFLKGFAEFEWRWQTDQFVAIDCPKPKWDGSNLTGKTILIHTEQGAGDAIQFVRYIPLVAAQAERVLLVCTDVLRPLLATVPGIDKIFGPGDISLRDFDTYIALMSLPHVLGTTLETIPTQVPYVRSPVKQSGKVDKWAGLVSALPDQLKVGIAWGGSPTQGNDRNRSCRLLDFLTLLRVPGVQFFSLQKGARVAELSDLPSDINLQDLNPHIHNWGDTAAAMEHLDLVIAVDTGVVHLAGALGKPVWVMLSFVPDWRWLSDRDDNPWYPTMRLFRQQRPGDWSRVFDQAIAALTEFVPPPPLSDISPLLPGITQQKDLSEASSSSSSSPQKIGIGWPVSITSGWGVYGLNLTLQLLQTQGYEPQLLVPSQLSLNDLNPVQQIQLASLWQEQKSVSAASNRHPKVPLGGFTLHALDSQFLGLTMPDEFNSQLRVGVVFREDTQISPQQQDQANAYDLIVSGSSWNTDLLKSQGIKQVRQVFQGIDPTLFYPGSKSDLWAGRFVIFSGGKLEYRKGQDIAIAAFKQFHQRHPEALLVTAWHNAWPQYMAGLEQTGYVVGLPQLSDQQQLLIPQWLAANGIPTNALCALGAIPNHQMGSILREVDAAVFPNRCEGGTNLAAMECLACGIPTILSANTGHLDLIEEQHCYPLRTQRPVKSIPTFKGVEGWGESEVEEIVEKLELIYTDATKAKDRGQAAAAFMADWSWQKQISRLLQVLEVEI